MTYDPKRVGDYYIHEDRDKTKKDAEILRNKREEKKNKPASVKDYDPKQPRDWRGRWAKTGSWASNWRDPKEMSMLEYSARASTAMQELTSGKITPEMTEKVAALGEDQIRRRKHIKEMSIEELEVEKEQLAEFIGSSETFGPIEHQANYWTTQIEAEIETREKRITAADKPWELPARDPVVMEKLRAMTSEERIAEGRRVEEYQEKIAAQRVLDRDAAMAAGDREAATRISSEYWAETEKVDVYRDQLISFGEMEPRDLTTLEKIEEYKSRYDPDKSYYERRLWEGAERRARTLREEAIFLAREAEVSAGQADRLAEVARLGLTDKTPGTSFHGESFMEMQREQVNEYADDAKVAKWQDAIRGSDVAIAFHVHNGMSIARDGFLNQHETDSSNGLLDPDSRVSLETGLWGIEDYDRHEFPVYGFLTPARASILNTQVEEQVSQYGDAVAILKPEMDERTTFTIGDSLNKNSWFSDGIEYASPEQVVFASPKLAPDPVALHKSLTENGEYITPFSSLRNNSGVEYIEAQIHGGGITADKIKEVRIFEKKSEVLYQDDSGYTNNSYTTAREFASRGVPVFVWSDDGEGQWVTLDPSELSVEQRKFAREEGLL